MKPYLVNSIQRDGIVLKQFSPTVLDEQVASPEAIAAARTSMEAVVKVGTGRVPFKDMPFPVAGKTGTAHVADGATKYSNGVYQATFVGYFPADQPQYTCIVVIRTKPHAAIHFGGSLGGPVFREIATKLYALYVDQKQATDYVVTRDSAAYFFAGNAGNIRKVFNVFHVPYTDSVQQASWVSAYATGNQPVVRANPMRDKQMPNVKGMGLKDALFLLESLGLKVTVNGKGKVNTQSLAPGSQITKGQAVQLQLS